MKRIMAMALGLVPGLAQAALPPCAYEDMIAEAELVIQVQVAQVLPPDDNGTCMVDGTIVRAFRGPLETGGPVRVRVPCDNPDGMVGADVYWSLDSLRSTPFIEVHGGIGQGIAGHGAGLFLIDAATEQMVWSYPAECGG